jgi:hypothetical protein
MSLQNHINAQEFVPGCAQPQFEEEVDDKEQPPFEEEVDDKEQPPFEEVFDDEEVVFEHEEQLFENFRKNPLLIERVVDAVNAYRSHCGECVDCMVGNCGVHLTCSCHVKEGNIFVPCEEHRESLRDPECEEHSASAGLTGPVDYTRAQLRAYWDEYQQNVEENNEIIVDGEVINFEDCSWDVSFPMQVSPNFSSSQRVLLQEAQKIHAEMTPAQRAKNDKQNAATLAKALQIHAEMTPEQKAANDKRNAAILAEAQQALKQLPQKQREQDEQFARTMELLANIRKERAAKAQAQN